VDPTLRAERVLPLEQVLRQYQSATQLAALTLGSVTLSVLLLAAAGIYALMSFTVAQRRREIGIRAALGARPQRIVVGVFSRALGQLSTGIVIGILVAAILDASTEGEVTGSLGPLVLPAVAALMMSVGLLAAVGPVRRSLRIPPTQALREE
jgi:ABC-type antimicrobial peptide transport system permease subunit